MSRIGKKPIQIPDKVQVTINGLAVSVKGPKGTLSQTFKGVNIDTDGKEVVVKPMDGSRTSRALWGMTRSIVSNMVTGVSTGFSKELQIHGVGYRAEVKGRVLNLSLGYSHPVNYDLPAGVDCEVDKMTTVKLQSADKQLLGQVAAVIRGFRPPEPYKGKGIRYSDEHIRRKAGKAAK